MLVRAVVVLAVLGAAARARAERDVQVEVAPGTPVDAAELARAVRVRVAETGAPIVVRVQLAGSDVLAAIDQRSRRVPLGGRTGADAARLVALAIADLALDDLAREPAVPALAVSAPPPTAAAPRPRTRLAVSLLGSAAGWSSPLAGGGLDVAAVRANHLVACELGLATLAGGPLHLDTATLRLAAGLRRGWLELRAGVTVGGLAVSNGAGDTTALPGAGASARLRVPVADRVRVVVAAGADAFAERTEYHVSSTTNPSTPWLAPWGSAGAEVTW